MFNRGFRTERDPFVRKGSHGKPSRGMASAAMILLHFASGTMRVRLELGLSVSCSLEYPTDREPRSTIVFLGRSIDRARDDGGTLTKRCRYTYLVLGAFFRRLALRIPLGSASIFRRRGDRVSRFFPLALIHEHMVRYLAL